MFRKVSEGGKKAPFFPPSAFLEINLYTRRIMILRVCRIIYRVKRTFWMSWRLIWPHFEQMKHLWKNSFLKFWCLFRDMIVSTYQLHWKGHEIYYSVPVENWGKFSNLSNKKVFKTQKWCHEMTFLMVFIKYCSKVLYWKSYYDLHDLRILGNNSTGSLWAEQ